MAFHNCANNCNGKASGRNLFCPKCWFGIPDHHKAEIRDETEKGEHTLRAHPTRGWLSKALRYLNEPQKF